MSSDDQIRYHAVMSSLETLSRRIRRMENLHGISVESVFEEPLPEDKKSQVIRVLKELRGHNDGGDTEQAHIKADKVLCEFLRFIGHGEVADAFEAHSFWYS